MPGTTPINTIRGTGAVVTTDEVVITEGVVFDIYYDDCRSPECFCFC